MRTMAMLLLAVGVATAEPPITPVVKKLIVTNSDATVTTLAWLPDGSSIVSVDDRRAIRVWNAATGNETASLIPDEKVAPKPITALAVSRDGKLIAAGLHTLGVRIWDRTANRSRTIARNAVFGDSSEPAIPVEEVADLAFSADTLRLSMVSSLYAIATFTTDGKQIGKSRRMPVQFGKGEPALIREEAAVSLQSGFGFAYYEGHEVDELRLWDFTHQKLLASIKLKEHARPYAEAVDPDGRWAVYRNVRDTPIRKLYLVDTRSLLEIRAMDLPKDYPNELRPPLGGFSRDGRQLLIYVGKFTAIYDTATGSIVAISPTRLSRSAFSPDYRQLAVSGGSSIVILNLQTTLDPTPPKSHDALACWNDLISADGTIAMRAVYRLADHPDESLKLIAEKVKPSARPAAEDVTTWLKNLDAPAFAERAAALKKLTPFADALESELTQEMAENASPEVVKSVAAMLETMQRGRRKLEGEYLSQ